MKKTSLITSLIGIVFIISFVLLISHTSVSSPNTSILVKVKGCPDCSQLYYCMDGVYMGPVGSCEFYINCKSGTHTICVKCNPNMDAGGSYTFDCLSGLSEIVIDINNSHNCNCDPPKKK